LFCFIVLVVKSLSHRPVQNQAPLLKGYVNLCSTVYVGEFYFWATNLSKNRDMLGF